MVQGGVHLGLYQLRFIGLQAMEYFVSHKAKGRMGPPNLKMENSMVSVYDVF